MYETESVSGEGSGRVLGGVCKDVKMIGIIFDLNLQSSSPRMREEKWSDFVHTLPRIYVDTNECVRAYCEWVDERTTNM